MLAHNMTGGNIMRGFSYVQVRLRHMQARYVPRSRRGQIKIIHACV